MYVVFSRQTLLNNVQIIFLSGFPKAKIKSSFKGDLLGGLVNLPRFVCQHLGSLRGVS